MKYAPRTLVGVPPVAWWVAQQGPSTVLSFRPENERGVKAEEQAAGIARDGDEGSAYGAYACAEAVRGARGRLGPWRTKYARGHWHAVHRGTCTRRILDLPWMERAGLHLSELARCTFHRTHLWSARSIGAHGARSIVESTPNARSTVHGSPR